MPRTRLSPRAASPRRWVLCAALLAGGFVVGGGLGTLVVMAGVCGGRDPAGPRPRTPRGGGEDLFARPAPAPRKRAPQLALVDDATAPPAPPPRREPGAHLTPTAPITA